MSVPVRLFIGSARIALTSYSNTNAYVFLPTDGCDREPPVLIGVYPANGLDAVKWEMCWFLQLFDFRCR